MKQKVLVIGASGLVGYSLYEHFSKEYEVYGTYNTHYFGNLIHLDLLNKAELKNILKQYDPTIILLPAALSSVEYCEEHKEECWKYNVTAHSNLIELIKDMDIKLVFFSTDYIFDGHYGPYTEEDIPNPLNNYGKAKLETENIIITNISDFLILRITVVYGWEHLGKNFIYSLIKNTKNNKIMKLPIDQIGSPTFVENISEATLKLIEFKKSGIYNVAGPALIDRYSFGLIAAEVFNLNKSLIKPVSTLDLNQKARRPLKAGLKIEKLCRDIQIQMLSPLDGLKSMINDVKDYVNIEI